MSTNAQKMPAMGCLHEGKIPMQDGWGGGGGALLEGGIFWGAYSIEQQTLLKGKIKHHRDITHS